MNTNEQREELQRILRSEFDKTETKLEGMYVVLAISKNVKIDGAGLSPDLIREMENDIHDF